MEENFMHTERLTPEERKIYDDLYVIRDKSKESLKQFRKDLIKHEAVVKRLEKKYGVIASLGPLKKKDNSDIFVSAMLIRVKSKYHAIGWNLGLYKYWQKRFTKELYDFPKDTKTSRGSLNTKLMGLSATINQVDWKISCARDELRISNKYLKLATDHEARDKTK